MRKLIIIAFISSICITCLERKSEKASQNIKNFTENIIDFEDEISLVKFSDIILDSPKVVFLETTDSSLIGKIDKIVINEDFIFILDTFIAEAVLIFNMDGKFIGKLASQGDGPNQYKKPLDIFIENDRIWILDNGRDIKVFNIQGNLLDSFKLSAFSAIRFQKLYDSDVFSFVSGDVDDNLIVTDNKFNKINSLFPYVDREIDMVILNSMYRSYETNDIIYRRNFNDTLYSINKEGNILPVKFIDYGRNRASYKQILDIKSNNVGSEVLAKYAYTTYFSENLDNEYLVFSYENNYWINIFDKKNKKSVLFKYVNYQNDLTFEKESYIAGTTENEMIFQVAAQSLENNKAKILLNRPDKFSSEFLQKLDNLNRDDNPILMFVRFDLSELVK